MSETKSLVDKLIPVGGTLAGTIVGWLLGFFGQRFLGRLTLECPEFQVRPLRADGLGSFALCALDDSEISHVEFGIKLVIHNGRSLPVAIVRPQMVLMDTKGKALLSAQLLYRGHGEQVLNVPAHNSMYREWSPSYGLGKDADVRNVQKADRAYVEYRVGRKKGRRFCLGEVRRAVVKPNPECPPVQGKSHLTG